MRALPELEGLPDDGWIHPLDAAALRPPIPNGGVRVIVIDPGPPPHGSGHATAAQADGVARGLLDLLRERNRPADAFVVSAHEVGYARALEQGLADGMHPIILITGGDEPWTAAHLDPLLAAIDLRDHAIGLRPASPPARARRWWRNLNWRILFAVPVVDVFSPCRLHRRVALEALVLQSSSRFLDVEILAKATFLTQVIEEVHVPPLRSAPVGPIRGDLWAICRHPRFVRRARPVSSSGRSAGRRRRWRRPRRSGSRGRPGPPGWSSPPLRASRRGGRGAAGSAAGPG